MLIAGVPRLRFVLNLAERGKLFDSGDFSAGPSSPLARGAVRPTPLASTLRSGLMTSACGAKRTLSSKAEHVVVL
jgi:hypothetical protein